MSKIRLLVVDDHILVRQGLISLLETQPELEVVGGAGSAEEALEQATRFLPDVVLMDVRMPGKSGIEACREIRQFLPRIQMLMLSSYSDEESIMAAIFAGAAGYVLKDADIATLLRDIHLVAQGYCLLDPAITARVFEKLRQLASREVNPAQLHLTLQERRLLQQIAQGKTNKEIASALRISEKTVRNYISNLLSKLNLSNRTQAAALAVRIHLGGTLIG